MSVEEIKIRNIQNVNREAKRLFNQQGVERTSVGMIADAAGITRRSVINYYESKNTLISAIEKELIKSNADALSDFLSTAEYVAMDGKSQILAAMGYVLNSLETQYATANVLTEISTILRRDGEIENRNDTTHSVNIITNALDPAYKKGLEDGSIDPKSAMGLDSGPLMALLMRGLYRQLAFIMECGKKHEKAQVKILIDEFLALVDKVLSNPV